MTDTQKVLDINDFMKKISGNKTIIDTEKIIETLLSDSYLDGITRIRDVEIDKISNMLHHTAQISAKMTRAYLTYSANKKEYLDNNKLFLCSGYKAIKQNLRLRLSMNSESRKEFENIFTSFFKKEIDRETQQNDKEEKK